MKNAKKSITDIIYIYGFIAITLFLVVKARYGFGRADEALYIITSDRIFSGDSLLFDEQHISQLYSFLMYPVMAFYRTFHKGNTGILISFRYIYIFFQALCSQFIYRRLKRVSEIGAAMAGLVFYIYAPYNLMALSYNTIAYSTLSASLILLCTFRHKYELFISGILYAASVLCCPYLALTYFAYSLVILVHNRKIIREWLIFSSGIFFLATIFVVFVFSRASLEEVLTSLPYILNDPEYQNRSFVSLAILLIESMLNISQHSLLISLPIMTIFAVTMFDRRRDKRIDAYLTALTIAIGLLVIDIAKTNILVNYIIYPVNILGLYIAIFDKELDRKWLYCYFIPALMYPIYNNFSSDCGNMAISSASIVALVMSFTVIGRELTNSNQTIGAFKAGMISLLFVGFILVITYERYVWTFGNIHILNCQNKITEGPYAGIYADDINYGLYQEALEETNELKEITGIANVSKKVVVLSKNLWKFLFFDNQELASPSAWKTIREEHAVSNLNDYYKNNPKKKADIIYADLKFKDEMETFEYRDEYKTKEVGRSILYYR